MIHRINRKKYQIFAFDVESHNDEESIAKRETSIWLGALIDENSKDEDDSSYVYTIEEFLKRLEDLTTQKQNKNKTKLCKNLAIYIYNLSFEWSFILPVLLKQGFQFKEKITDDDEFVYNTVSTKSVSSVWHVNLKFGKKCGEIIFRDLAKIFGGGLGKVAKAFGLPTQKGEIDYKLNRLKYYDEYDFPHYFGDPGEPIRYTPTKEEKIYCFKDTRIIIDILLKVYDDKEFWNIDSMASYSMKKMIKESYPRTAKPYERYRKEYPELGEDETKFLRNATSGGITYATSRFQFKEINEDILHIDMHQAHPTSLYQNLFPYGYGKYGVGKPNNFCRINCCHIRISYSDVKLHSIIKLIGIDFIDDFELWVWDFEIPTMMKCYVNLEIEYIDYYAYDCKTPPFKKYVHGNYTKRLEAKKRKDDFYILYYKLLNNSAYGKFLEKPHNDIYANYIREDNIIDSIVTEKEDKAINARYTYLGVGATIPAYTRVRLVETALLFGWENVVYFDTDSIFIKMADDTMKIWNSIDQIDHLGGWGLEEIIKKAQFTAPKRYKYTFIDEESGEEKTVVKMAGINGLNDVSYDEINIVSSKWQVRRAFRCKGGTVIDLQQKEVAVQEKYKDIYLKNKSKKV